MKSSRQSFYPRYLNKNLLISASFILLINYKFLFGYISKPYLLLNKYCFKLVDNVFDFLQTKDDLKEEIEFLRWQQRDLLDSISQVSKLPEGILAQIVLS